MKKLWKILIPLISIIAFAGPSTAIEKKINHPKAYIISSVNDNELTSKNKDVLISDKIKLRFIDESFSEINSSCKVEWSLIKPELKVYNNWRDKIFSIDRPNYYSEKIKETSGLEMKIENPAEGTFRYSASLICNGKRIISTPAEESLTQIGISDEVHRISFRKDNSFLGWLSSFKNLPYIYGSTNEQVEKYIGMDCADLIVGARKKAGLKTPKENIRAADIPRFAKMIMNYKDLERDSEGNFYQNEKPIIYGRDIKNSDLILFYEPNGNIWHVGALIDGKNGEQLNTKSYMMHTLANFPEEKQIGYYGGFSILRWE